MLDWLVDDKPLTIWVFKGEKNKNAGSFIASKNRTGIGTEKFFGGQAN